MEEPPSRALNANENTVAMDQYYVFTSGASIDWILHFDGTEQSFEALTKEQISSGMPLIKYLNMMEEHEENHKQAYEASSS